MTKILAERPAPAPQRGRPADPRPCRAPDVDPEWFFPAPADAVIARRAKQLCDGCPIRVACLAIALARNETFGIWGGLTEHERRRLPRTHPCRRCGTPATLRFVYCGDKCRRLAKAARVARYDRSRRLAVAR
jgi:hypothetical protein